METATLTRRLVGMLYEALILVALWIVAGFPFVGLTQGLDPAWVTPLFRLYLLLVTGLYFTWFWRHGGQTLPMKTWRIRLVSADGGPVTRRQAWLRYGAALLGIPFLGVGLWWAWFDSDRQFLHDRLAGTRLVRLG